MGARRSIVMENTVIRGRARHSAVIGNDVLVGPHAHVNGARVGGGCFLATGVALFWRCVARTGSEMRIHGVVQVNTVPPPGITVPIGRVAVGDPAKIYPGEHEQIRGIQVSVDFPGTVYGVTRDMPAGLRVAHRAHNDRNCVSPASATRQCNLPKVTWADRTTAGAKTIIRRAILPAA